MTHVNGEYIEASAPSSSSRPARRGSTVVDVVATDDARCLDEAQFDEDSRPRAPLIRRGHHAGRGRGHGGVLLPRRPRMDEAAFAKVVGNDPLGRSMLGGAVERFAETQWDARRCTKRRLSWRGARLTLRKAQADPLRGHGSLVGPPLFESLHLLGASARWRGCAAHWRDRRRDLRPIKLILRSSARSSRWCSSTSPSRSSRSG